MHSNINTSGGRPAEMQIAHAKDAYFKVYTPEKHILLFELVEADDGTPMVRVKRGKTYDLFPLTDLLAQLVCLRVS